MITYIARRAFHAVFVMLGVVTLVFFIARLSGDPVGLMLPVDASVEQEQALRRQLRLDEPLPVQYWDYLTGVLQGDLGRSFRYNESTGVLIAERIPATLQLTVVAVIMAVVVAFGAGMLAAKFRGSVLESGIMSVVLLGQSTPSFLVGILLILVFAVQLGWLPAAGGGSWSHVILPAATLGLALMASMARLLRSSMLEVLNEDFIRTAKGKGVAPYKVVGSHALSNAVLPVITVIGVETGTLLGGAVVTETVFGYPGVGQLLIQSIYNRDYGLVQGIIVVLAGIFVLVNLIVDVLYSVLDPRIRYE